MVNLTRTAPWENVLVKTDATAEPTGAEPSGPAGADDEAAKPEEPRLRNPFRNEADAFRLFVLTGLAIAFVVVAAKVGGSWVGLAAAVAVLLIASRATYRWFRLALSEREL